jgi:hypothetical protein
MKSVSLTQTTNYASIAAALVIITRVLSTGDIASLTEGDWLTLIAGIGIVVTSLVNFHARYKRGDITVAGVRKF